MTAFEVVQKELDVGMAPGNMHGCLRDAGRLAGGYVASGAISGGELAALENMAVQLSKNKGEGARKWSEAVEFGRRQPVAWDAELYEGRALEWDAPIGSHKGDNNLKVVDCNWLEDMEVQEPEEWDPVEELRTYISLLFEGHEHVGYVTETWEKDGKLLPKRGCWDRTAEQLLTELGRCGGDVHAVFGDTKEEAGAWIRFNPLDGEGVKDANVTDFRYALVESDSQSIPRQMAIIRELELPVMTLVHSGKKSLHAVVRIEADTFEEYRKRVDFLYEVCGKNGLEIDRQNRNPSRLSRMPGIMRNGCKQFLVGSEIGKGSWKEWSDWIEDINDDLPEFEALQDVFNNLPDKAPELIAGVLREGHKMRLAGPSKAGKSFALIQLVVAIAEGTTWFGWKCAKGKVLYVNLEQDRASCLHRFADIYKALGLPPDNIRNIDIWNLRGKAVPMDKLAPKLIRRALQKRYKAVVIDPIYKVITGDENSADAMSHFCNQFDKICAELGAAVIDCHHHSKGEQGQKKSADRASGSGVFARDPDALLDLMELEAKEPKKVLEGRTVCDAMTLFMDAVKPGWDSNISEDDALVEGRFMEGACKLLTRGQQDDLRAVMVNARRPIEDYTAWRVEGTLREFATFKPRNLWFKYPVHKLDDNLLKDVEVDGKWQQKGAKADKKSTADQQAETAKSFIETYEMCSFGDSPVTVQDIADRLGVVDRTIKNWICRTNKDGKKLGFIKGFKVDRGQIKPLIED